MPPPSTETHATTEGEQPAQKPKASSEGEKSEAVKDKGKTPLTTEQLAEIEKLEKERLKYGTRPADAQTLKLKAPSPQETNLGLSPKELEEARIAQKALDESAALSLKVAQEEAKGIKSTDVVSVQRKVLSAIEEEREEEIRWYKTKMHHRASRSPISGIKIGTSRANPKDIRLIVDREDGSIQSMKEHHLKTLGLPEWYEVSRLLAAHQNSKKESFVKTINELMTKMKEIKRRHNIVLTTEERSRLESLKEEVRLPISKNPPDSVFKDMAKEGKIPNVRNLNLNLPTSATYPTTTLAISPIPGLYFNDGYGKRAFFRFSQIARADTLFLHGIQNLFPNIPEAQPHYREVLDEIKRRQLRK